MAEILSGRASLRCCLLAALLGSPAAPRLAAQYAIYAADDSKPETYSLIRDVSGLQPMVIRDGQLKPAKTHRYVIYKVDEFLPVFIAIRDLLVGADPGVYDPWNAEAQKNNSFVVHGVFESPYRLEHVYLFLELNSANGGRASYFQQVGGGTLEPRRPERVDASYPLASDFEHTSFRIHLFSDGREVLTSQIPFDERERVLDRMVRKRTLNVQNAPPRPFVGPPPEYPKALLKSKAIGAAVIRVRIARNGGTCDPVVASATDPAFGQSALEAIRMWRFLPRIRDGEAVETDVDVPIRFNP